MKLKNKHIHIIGIGGISMSAIALLLSSNNIISGSDATKSKITEKLENLNIKVSYKHSPQNVIGADVVIVSAAIAFDNVELVEAKKMKLKIYNRAEVLGIISKQYKNVIAISGSHGKTTTTGMIATCFLNAGLEPTIHIGGIMKQINSNVLVGKSNYFITEACEYVDSFLQLSPNSTVALNIEPDHLDYFKTFDNLKKSFKQYLKNTKPLGFNIVNADDTNIIECNSKRRTLTYGIKNKSAIIIAKNLRKGKFSRYSFDVYYKDKKLFRVKLPVSGKHEIYNALACICVCMQYKIDIRIIKNSLERFQGIKRRFEEVGCINGAVVIHDYAHHPTEIEANINAVKNEKVGRVIVVFQPHTYSRTKALFDDFVRVLCLSDIVYLYKIYPAREAPIEGITTDIVSDKIRGNGVSSQSFDNFEELKIKLENEVKKGDTILILGAGDIENFCDLIGK